MVNAPSTLTQLLCYQVHRHDFAQVAQVDGSRRTDARRTHNRSVLTFRLTHVYFYTISYFCNPISFHLATVPSILLVALPDIFQSIITAFPAMFLPS